MSTDGEKTLFNPKITPGTWWPTEVVGSFIVDPLVNEGERSESVARVDVLWSSRSKQEHQHNAKAISAVPELLEISKKAKDVITRYHKHRDALWRAEFVNEVERLEELIGLLESKYATPEQPF